MPSMRFLELVILQAFIETTEHTLQKGFVKTDLHLLLCDDEVWKNWVTIMKQYARGLLPNMKGETLDEGSKENPKFLTMKGGQIQQAPGTVTLASTLFRCISGLERSDVLELQNAILNKTILLKKGKHIPHRMDMEEMAWKLKTDRVLKEAILSFFFDLTREKLPWEQICQKYKLGEHEYNQIRSYSHHYVKDTLNRAKKNPSLPKSVVTLLNHLFRANMGLISQDESIPWKIKGVGFDMRKIKEFCDAEHVPFQLVVLDVHGTKEQLSTDFFANLALSLNTLNAQYEYVLVCFIDFINIGMLVEGISSQAAKVHIEYGTIQTTRHDSWIDGTVEIAMVALFVSKVDRFEVIDKAPTKRVFFSGCSGGKNQEFIDRGFIDGLITGFCPEQSYVLEMFCSGIVLKQSLLKKRRVIALCKDDFEAMELESQCSALLESNVSLQEWCGASQVSLARQTVELDDAEKEDVNNLDIDEQQSEGEDSNENEDDDNLDNMDDGGEVKEATDFDHAEGGDNAKNVSAIVDVEGEKETVGTNQEQGEGYENAGGDDGTPQNTVAAEKGGNVS